VGGMSLLDQGPRSATVRAVERRGRDSNPRAA
jgi:hypothetical protein